MPHLRLYQVGGNFLGGPRGHLRAWAPFYSILLLGTLFYLCIDTCAAGTVSQSRTHTNTKACDYPWPFYTITYILRARLEYSPLSQKVASGELKVAGQSCLKTHMYTYIHIRPGRCGNSLIVVFGLVGNVLR